MSNPAKKLWVSGFKNVKDRTVRQAETDWPTLVKRFSVHEYRQDKDGPLWSPTRYREGATRGNEGVLEVWAAVGDFEGPQVPPPEKMGLFLQVFRVPFLVHSTWSHMQEKHNYVGPAYRVIVPLSKPVLARDWPDAWQRLNYHLFFELADGQAKDAARIYYTPSCPVGSTPLVIVGDGSPLPEPPDTDYGDPVGRAVFLRTLKRLEEEIQVGTGPVLSPARPENA